MPGIIGAFFLCSFMLLISMRMKFGKLLKQAQRINNSSNSIYKRIKLKYENLYQLGKGSGDPVWLSESCYENIDCLGIPLSKAPYIEKTCKWMILFLGVWKLEWIQLAALCFLGVMVLEKLFSIEYYRHGIDARLREQIRIKVRENWGYEKERNTSATADKNTNKNVSANTSATVDKNVDKNTDANISAEDGQSGREILELHEEQEYAPELKIIKERNTMSERVIAEVLQEFLG